MVYVHIASVLILPESIVSGISGDNISKDGSPYYIGMTQVCQHYAHTFEKFKFHFHYESDPTFDRLAHFVCSKNACTLKMVKIARSVLNLFKKVSFQNCSCCCCCCSV